MADFLIPLIALFVGGGTGFLIAKSIASARVSAFESQLSRLTQDCETERQRANASSVSEATASAERSAAVAETARAETERQAAISKAEELRIDVQALRSEKSDLTATVASLTSQINSKVEALALQRQWVEEQSTNLQTLFSNTANKLLEERAAKFGEQNKEQMQGILAPFEKQILEFRQRIDHIHTEDAKANASLERQIETLARSAFDVGSKADQLANAMLGNVKHQGEWGQLQLTVLLQKAGFVEGTHFSNQVIGENDEDEKRIADTVMWLPNGETLVIDAKVTLPSWTAFCGAEDKEQRSSALKDMIASTKAHYVGLAGKDYARIVGKGRSIPFTVMFMPIEPAGLEILRAEPDLFNDARKKNIIIVTPTSLFSVLHLVSSLWTFQAKQNNALEIAEEGRLLLKKLGGFIDTFMDIGGRLDSAVDSFAKAKGQLHVGRGNVMSIANRMATLGVEAPTKGEMPALMLAAEEVEAEVIPLAQLTTTGPS